MSLADDLVADWDKDRLFDAIEVALDTDPLMLRDALTAVLSAAEKWETGMDGPSVVGRAFADTARTAIARALGVEGTQQAGTP